MRLAVFASGDGTNLQAIIDSISQKRLLAQVALVLSNNSNAYALERARAANIPSIVLSSNDFGNREEFVCKMLRVLDERDIDFIALAGYMKKVPPEVIERFRNRITNIHPALLPSFGGKGMYGMNVHRAVLECGCKVSGVTVHIVDEIYDHGAIIAQRCVPVVNDDTPETLAERIHKVEHQLYPEVLQWFAEGRVLIQNGKAKILD